MGQAYFYHLTRQPLEATLTTLLGKSLAAGWRVVVRGQSRDRLEWLDQKLWLGPEEHFLPHGLSGGAHDAAQPVLLTDQVEVPNEASCVMSIDGADVSAEEIARFDRVCILFDGHDPAALDHARGQWKRLSDSGVHALYWSEESGQWQKKAEANAPSE
jgi:DNA polymerase-3 subunit chi